MRYKCSHSKSVNSSLACEIDYHYEKVVGYSYAILIWLPAQISEYIIVF